MARFGGYEDQPFNAEFCDFIPGYASRPDLDFYLDFARSAGGKVLEPGDGTGRGLLRELGDLACRKDGLGQGDRVMATGRSMQLTKQVGEYLVAAELCRRRLIATTFTGNVPDFDILAIDEQYRTVPIQVKTIRGVSWQFDAGKFLKIQKNNGRQEVTGKTNLPYADLLCIFVRLVRQGQDEFYIFRIRDLQDIIDGQYRGFLKSKEGVRPRNPGSTHTAVWPTQLAQFRDNWDLLSDSFGKGYVLP